MKTKRKIRINKSRFSRVIIIAAIAIVITGSLLVLPNTFSRFYSGSESTTKVNIAYSLLNVEDLSTTIKLDDIIPNGQYQEYVFSVKNYDDDGNRIDVDMKYYVELTTTTNIPIEYELLDEHDNIMNASKALVTDDYGTIFNKITTSDFNVPYNRNVESVFKIKYKLDTIFTDEIFSDLSDLIDIKINVEQVV